ncbi:porin [Herbaspirillum sp. NPDC087042]|uniref:porin n=1 Tax=Herbaspirillum sp. NPDC087042 TaxID=3364004 RepID=UPI00381458CB
MSVFTASAHAQSSVTIYGAVDASLSYTNKIITSGQKTGSLVALDSGLLKGSRLGVKGVEDLGGGLKALFTIENGFNLDTGEAGQKGVMWGRQSTVGLAGNFGTVLAGRQKDVLDDIGSITSAGDFGGVVSRVHSLNLDRTNGERVNNSIRYNTPDLHGFTGSVIYGFGEEAGNGGSGQSFGLGGMYANGPLNIGLGYFQSKMGDAKTASDVNGAAACNGNDVTKNKNGDVCLRTWTLATAYQFGPVKVYGAYSSVKLPLARDGKFNPTLLKPNSYGFEPGSNYVIGGFNNESTSTWDLGAKYSLAPAVSLIGSVQFTRAKFVKKDDGRLTQFSLGAKYDLSKRTTAYTVVTHLRSADMYNVGLAKDRVPGIDRSQTAVSAGVIHSF